MKNNINTSISYGILLLLLVPEISSPEISFVFICFYLIYMAATSKFIIPKPHIIGYKFLYCYLFVALIIGLFNSGEYGFYQVLRDGFYVIRPLIIIYLGYYLSFKMGDKKDIIKTILTFAAAFSLISMFRLITNFSSLIHQASLWDLKGDVIILDNIIPFSFAIIMLKNYFGINYFFSRKIDSLLLLLYLFTIIFSFSRTNIGLLIIFTSILFLSSNKGFTSIKNLTKLLFGILVTTLFIIVLVKIMPNNFLSEFIIKTNNSFTEISDNLNWNNDAVIVQNWRGYEIYQAKELFANGSVFNQIFGFGFGKLIPVRLSELVGIPASNGGITILHHGYYMVVIKGGILGLILLIMFFLENIRKTVLIIKSKKILWECSLLLALICGIIFETFFVTGLFKPTSSVWMSLLIGALNGYIIQKNNH